MKSEEFDNKFDNGDPILKYFNLEKIRRPDLETKRVNVDFPIWMMEFLDREARRLGINRQAVIKTWIARIIDETAA